MPSSTWQDVAAARMKQSESPYSGMNPTDALALATADQLLPTREQQIAAKKRNPLRLAALRSMFPMAGYGGGDAQGGMR